MKKAGHPRGDARFFVFSEIRQRKISPAAVLLLQICRWPIIFLNPQQIFADQIISQPFQGDLQFGQDFFIIF